ncbi:hypothetical protein IAU59_006964 [Kwoniella sp. CBS 9459]
MSDNKSAPAYSPKTHSFIHTTFASDDACRTRESQRWAPLSVGKHSGTFGERARSAVSSAVSTTQTAITGMARTAYLNTCLPSLSASFGSCLGRSSTAEQEERMRLCRDDYLWMNGVEDNSEDVDQSRTEHSAYDFDGYHPIENPVMTYDDPTSDHGESSPYDPPDRKRPFPPPGLSRPASSMATEQAQEGPMLKTKDD